MDWLIKVTGSYVLDMLDIFLYMILTFFVLQMHAEIRYSEEEQQYTIQDKASQQGTFLNNKRLSPPKKMSAWRPLRNGDALRLGGTTFDIHIHAGSNTCDGCEPGVVRMKMDSQAKQGT